MCVCECVMCSAPFLQGFVSPRSKIDRRTGIGLLATDLPTLPTSTLPTYLTYIRSSNISSRMLLLARTSICLSCRVGWLTGWLVMSTGLCDILPTYIPRLLRERRQRPAEGLIHWLGFDTGADMDVNLMSLSPVRFRCMVFLG